MLYALWALAGWCGTPWPGWWRGPRPHPDPDPWIIKLVAVVGGVLGGWAVSKIALASTVPDTAPAMVAATTLGAFVGGRVLSEIAIIIIGGRSAAKDVVVVDRAGD